MSRSQLFQAATLLLILALAAYLRWANLADNPGWYTDEGTHLDIAQNLLDGRAQYLAVSQSTLLFAKLSLFEGALAVLLRFGGGGAVIHVPGVAEMLREIETWPMAFEVGAIAVYRNPAR